MDELIELYKKLLKYFSCAEDAEGGVVNTYATPNTPVFIKDKRLVLPYREYTSKSSTERIQFHPLPEEITKGPSEVLEFLKDNMTVKLNTTCFALLHLSLALAKNPKLTKDIDPDLKDIVSSMGAVVNKTVATKLMKIIKTASSDQSGNTSFLKIFLRQGKSISGVRYSRAGIVTFPFYNLVIEDKPVLLGTEITKEERDGLKRLIEAIIPNIDRQDEYSRGSDIKLCPYLDALVRSSSAVVSATNHASKLFEAFITDGLEGYLVDTEVVSVNFDDWSKKWNVLPPQAGNEGKSSKEDTTKPAGRFDTDEVNRRLEAEEPRKLSGVLDPRPERPMRQSTQRGDNRDTRERSRDRDVEDPVTAALRNSRNYDRGDYRDERRDRDRGRGRDRHDDHYDDRRGRGGRSVRV